MLQLPTANNNNGGHDFHAELSYRWHELNQLIKSPPAAAAPAKHTVQSQLQKKLPVKVNHSAVIKQVNNDARRRQSVLSHQLKQPVNRRVSQPLQPSSNSIYTDIELQQQKQAELKQWKQQHKQEKQQQQALEKQRIRQFKQNLHNVKSHISKDAIVSPVQKPTAQPSSVNAHCSGNKAHATKPHNKQVPMSNITNTNSNTSDNNIIMTPPPATPVVKRHTNIISKSDNKLKVAQRIPKPQLSPAAQASAEAIRRDRRSRANHVNKPAFELVVKDDTTDPHSDEALNKTLVKPASAHSTDNTQSRPAAPAAPPSKPVDNTDSVARLKLQVESTKSLVIEWIGSDMFDKLYTHIKSLKPIDLNAPMNLQLVVHQPIANLLQPNQHKVLRHVQKLVTVENLLDKQRVK